MINVLVHHKVADYQRWKKSFDSSIDFRHDAGERSCRIFCSPDNPRAVTLLLEWESEEQARSFMTSDELRARMQQAGVLSHPSVEFMHELYTIRRSAAD